MITGTVPNVGGASPFKFLDYFTEADEEILEGRDRGIDLVVNGVLQSRAFVLYGESGSGKTSMLRAGVFPEMRRRGFLPIYVRILTAPEDDLSEALGCTAESERPETEQIRTRLAELTEESPVVLVFDQFEEFFIGLREEPEVRQRFVETLHEFANDEELRVRLLFALRQDYLAEMDDFRDHMPDLFDNEYRLRSLSAFGARQAIGRQLEHSQVPYEPQLLTELVDLLEVYKYDPTILQVVLHATYQNAANSSDDEVYLTRADLGSIGGVEELFRTSLDSFSDSLDEGQQLTGRVLLEKLITREHTKRALTVRTVVSEGYRGSTEDVQAVLEILSEFGLVRREPRRTETWYELTHERLVEIIARWLQVDQSYHLFSKARDLISSAASMWRERPATLLSRDQLVQVVRPIRDQLELSREESEFLVASSILRSDEESFRYWSKVFGYTEAEELVAAQLKSPLARAGDIAEGKLRDQMRASAALSASWLPAWNDLETINRLVLDSGESEDVRTAAAKASARLGGAGAIVQALGDPATRVKAKHALVQLHTTGIQLPDMERRERRSIRRSARRWLLKQNRRDIRLSALGGAWRGLRASGLWILCVGLPVFVLNGWTQGQTLAQSGVYDDVMLLAGVIILTALMGAALGGGVSWAGAKTIALQRRESVIRTVFLSLMMLTTVWLALGAMDSWLDYPEEFWFYLLWGGAAGLFAAVLNLLIAVQARLIMRASFGISTDVARLAMSLLGSIGLPFLIPLVLSIVLFNIWPTEFEAWEAWPAVGAFVSWGAIVCAYCVDNLDTFKLESSTRTARSHTRVFIGALAANAVVFVTVFGLDTLPAFAQHVDLAVGDSLKPHLGPGVPDATHYKFTQQKSELAIVLLGGRIDESHISFAHDGIYGWNSSLLFDPSSSRPYGNHVLVVPRGSHTASVTHSYWDGNPYTDTLELTPASTITLGKDVVPEDWAPAVVVLRKVSETLDGTDFVVLRDTIGSREPLAEPGGKIELFIAGNNASLMCPFSCGQFTIVPRDGDTSFVPFRAVPGPMVVRSNNQDPLRIAVSDNRDWEAEVSLEVWYEQIPDSVSVVLWLRRPEPDVQTLERETEASREAYVIRLSFEADSRARDGDILVADSLMRVALELDSALVSASELNSLCWQGSLMGHVRQVLPYCNLAVAKDSANGNYRDSRGLALALTGDYRAAIEDFSAFVEWSQVDSLSERRRAWVAELTRGEDPFTAALLDSLKTEVYLAPF